MNSLARKRALGQLAAPAQRLKSRFEGSRDPRDGVAYAALAVLGAGIFGRGAVDELHHTAQDFFQVAGGTPADWPVFLMATRGRAEAEARIDAPWAVEPAGSLFDRVAARSSNGRLPGYEPHLTRVRSSLPGLEHAATPGRAITLSRLKHSVRRSLLEGSYEGPRTIATLLGGDDRYTSQDILKAEQNVFVSLLGAPAMRALRESRVRDPGWSAYGIDPLLLYPPARRAISLRRKLYEFNAPVTTLLSPALVCKAASFGRWPSGIIPLEGERAPPLVKTLLYCVVQMRQEIDRQWADARGGRDRIRAQAAAHLDRNLEQTDYAQFPPQLRRYDDGLPPFTAEELAFSGGVAGLLHAAQLTASLDDRGIRWDAPGALAQGKEALHRLGSLSGLLFVLVQEFMQAATDPRLGGYPYPIEVSDDGEVSIGLGDTVERADPRELMTKSGLPDEAIDRRLGEWDQVSIATTRCPLLLDEGIFNMLRFFVDVHALASRGLSSGGS